MLENCGKALTRRLLQDNPGIGAWEVSEGVTAFVKAVVVPENLHSRELTLVDPAIGPLSASRPARPVDIHLDWSSSRRGGIKFRELNCNFYGDEGSIAQVAINDCFLDATTDRAKELKRLMPEN